MKNLFLVFLLFFIPKIINAQSVINETYVDPFRFVLLIEGHLAENGIGAVKFKINSTDFCFIFTFSNGLIRVLDNDNNLDYYVDELSDSLICTNTVILKKDDLSIFKLIPDTTMIDVYFINRCEFDLSGKQIRVFKVSEISRTFVMWTVVTITNFDSTCDNYYICTIPGGYYVKIVKWEEKYGDIDEFYMKILRGIEYIQIARVKP